MLGLISLPYEVLSNIVGNVSIEDAFSLGQTCQSLKYLLKEESICKLILQVSCALPCADLEIAISICLLLIAYETD